MTRKPSPDEMGKALERFLDDEDWDRVYAMSDEEIATEARETGIDVQRARDLGERAAIEFAKTKKDAQARMGVTELAVRRRAPEGARSTWLRKWGPTLAIAAGVLIVAGGVWKSWPVDPPPEAVTHPNDDDRPAAQRLRLRAASTFGQGRWREGLAQLDEAKKLDPEGDREPEVQDARRVAEAELAAGQRAASGDAGRD